MHFESSLKPSVHHSPPVGSFSLPWQYPDRHLSSAPQEYHDNGHFGSLYFSMQLSPMFFFKAQVQSHKKPHSSHSFCSQYVKSGDRGHVPSLLHVSPNPGGLALGAPCRRLRKTCGDIARSPVAPSLALRRTIRVVAAATTRALVSGRALVAAATAQLHLLLILTRHVADEASSFARLDWAPSRHSAATNRATTTTPVKAAVADRRRSRRSRQRRGRNADRPADARRGRAFCAVVRDRPEDPGVDRSRAARTEGDAPDPLRFALLVVDESRALHVSRNENTVGGEAFL